MSKTTKKAVSKSAKKTLKKLVARQNRRTNRINKAFEKLSPAEKRVYIARDVLEQIRLKRLIPTSGVWLADHNENPLIKLNDVKADSEVQDIVAKTKKCT